MLRGDSNASWFSPSGAPALFAHFLGVQVAQLRAAMGQQHDVRPLAVGAAVRFHMVSIGALQLW